MRTIILAFAVALAAGLTTPLPVTAQTPAPPDYALDDAWICRPGRDDACAVDLSAAVVTADGERRIDTPASDDVPAIDCFYVYPTISTTPGDSAPIAVTEDEARTVRLQLARLRWVCRLYAPLYRQLTVSDMKRRLEGGQTPDLPAAMALAESDIAAAWAHYLAHDNAGRGVVLIGHSQGALILQGLIREKIDGGPLMAQLVSAVLPGSFVTAPTGQDVGGTFKVIPACRKTTQTGCVIAFNSFRADAPPPEGYEAALDEGERTICTNPAALEGGPARLRPYFAADRTTIIPWFSAPPRKLASDAPPFVAPRGLSATCVDEDRGGYLSITADPANYSFALDGDFVFEGRRDAAMGLHLIDLELVMGDLVEVIDAQGRAYAAQTAPRP
jgi:hypothetical protein